MDENNSSENRKILLINPRFQLAFMGYMLAIILVSIFVFYIANMYSFRQFKSLGSALGLAPNHPFFEFLKEQQKSFQYIFLVTAVVDFVLLFVIGLYVSHRVAGPIHRLNNHLKALAGGKTRSELKFRKKDFFPEVADNLNEFLKKQK